MGNSSFLSKLLFVSGFIILAVLGTFFIVNKDDSDKNMEELGIITSVNVNTYDEDLYIYDLKDEKLLTSPYFYNKYYLNNNEVDYEEYKITDKSKFFLKTLSNTEKDINNIKITYDPITEDEFIYLLNNYSLLKVYIWLDKNNNCKNVLLYSSNNIELELEHY